MIQFIDGSNGLLLFSVKPSNKEDIAKGLKDGIDVGQTLDFRSIEGETFA
jgi:galactokinase/mevalonate kinase-like predicted kinase